MLTALAGLLTVVGVGVSELPDLDVRQIAVARAALTDPTRRLGVSPACIREVTSGSTIYRSPNNSAAWEEMERHAPAGAVVGFSKAPAAKLTVRERQRINAARRLLDGIPGPGAMKVPRQMTGGRQGDVPAACQRFLSLSTPEIENGVAFISLPMTCGDLCGEGGELVMIRRKRRWHFVGFGPRWVS